MIETIIDVLSAILIAAATGAISILFAYLQTKIKSEKTRAALSALAEATIVTVGKLQQTVVNGWKEAGGGKLTEEQIEALKQAVIDETKALLDDPTKAVIKSIGADVDAIIRAYAENAVREINQA